MPKLSADPRRQPDRLGSGGPARARARFAALGTAAALAIIGVAGCAKMSAALGQQWIVVLFNPNTTVATARHVTQACSHVPNLHLAPVRAVSGDPGMIGSARYDATNATDANMAELQQCLQRFPSVQGFNLIQPGDS
ncbi:MAG TPA: hypothetical protein VN840_00355 [Streptosporangiaceae bacterium]|nr:hypothetical protein [Streptosporangiaceae bacterium]